jgi:hypothetical protein
MNAFWAVIGFIVVLIGAAIFVPQNSLTGHIVQEGTCKGLGCLELCDQEMENACSEGLTCCSTQWSTGVCDYEVNCEQIREYSLYQTLETYQDSVREQPAPIEMNAKFFVVLASVIAIILYFVFKRRDPEYT